MSSKATSKNYKLKDELKTFVKNHNSMCARLNEKLLKGREALGIRTLEDLAKFKQ